MSTSDDDSQERFALGLVFALVALILSAVVGTVVVQRLGGAGPMVAAPGAGVVPAAGAATAADVASVQVDGAIVRFYFAAGSAALAAGASEALADVAKGTADGRKAIVSGDNDATGDAARNAELAKQRALAVADALKALGVPDDRIELRKPEDTTAAGTSSNAEARRVDVALSAP